MSVLRPFSKVSKSVTDTLSVIFGPTISFCNVRFVFNVRFVTTVVDATSSIPIILNKT
jgi:hypothetical protein